MNILNIYNSVLNLNTESTLRRKKLFELRNFNVSFPNNFHKNSISNQLYFIYGNINNKNLLKLNINVNVAGRIINKRIFGNVSFFVLQDIGGKIQIYISRKYISNIKYDEYLKKIDIGDIIGVQGFLFKTKTKELTIYCNNIYLLTKSVRLLPNKFHGLINREIKYRKRYLDLISNNKSLNIFKTRSNFIYEIRFFMKKNKFIEVETPMMQLIPGGASAFPFSTYHNSLNVNMYLRISPELYLKRLIIGGFEKIFEINRSFRNEGISLFHNPEFTMIELYMAYTNYHDLIYFLEDLFRFFIKKFLNNNNIVNYDNNKLNLNPPFIKMSMKEAICFYCSKINFKVIDDIKYISTFAKSVGININKNYSLNKVQIMIFEHIIEKCLIQPTIITDFPVEVSPLARRKDTNPILSDRFEFFINGYEIGNGFSELNDPEDQSMRFFDQIKFKNKHYKKDIFYDNDYISALEYGLPPTSGIGIGIDRLVMLFTNSQNIRDVILFPMLRPI